MFRRSPFRFVLCGLAAAALLILAVAEADAARRSGGGFGSRGNRTFTPPAATQTAPNAAAPINRSVTQPQAQQRPGTVGQAAQPGGLFGGRMGGFMGGMLAGFLGAGLLGMLFGGSLFGGLGGIASFLGLLLQVGLIALVAMFALRWWRSRNAPSYASGPANFDAGQAQPSSAPQRGGMGPGIGATGAGLGGGMGAGAGLGGGLAPAAPAASPIKITPEDYDAFERLLGEVQAAWSNEDRAALSRLTTPEMESYFAEDLADNASHGVVNKVTNVKLLQGDLAEAWHEGSDDYATVAMRFSLVDKTVDRATGKVVEGGDEPVEATELWTFVRPNNASWMLSAIQQTA